MLKAGNSTHVNMTKTEAGWAAAVLGQASETQASPESVSPEATTQKDEGIPSTGTEQRAGDTTVPTVSQPTSEPVHQPTKGAAINPSNDGQSRPRVDGELRDPKTEPNPQKAESSTTKPAKKKDSDPPDGKGEASGKKKKRPGGLMIPNLGEKMQGF